MKTTQANLSKPNTKPQPNTKYIICGVGSWGLEFNTPAGRTQELNGMLQCGLYETVDFIQVDDVLRQIVTLSKAGIEYWSTKAVITFNEIFYVTLKK